MIRRFTTLLIALAAVFTLAAQPKYEVRAVWLTTIGGIDWPHSYAGSARSIERQKEELRDILDRLQRANIENGISNVELLAYTVPIENSITIQTRSIMGTEIPHVKYVPDAGKPTYSFSTTHESIDKAREAFRKVKDLTIKLSMVENAAYRLASNIKKTQKRANALQNITIPMYSSLVYTITNALEEKDREEFTRLKVIKRMKEKKAARR